MSQILDANFCNLINLNYNWNLVKSYQVLSTLIHIYLSLSMLLLLLLLLVSYLF